MNPSQTTTSSLLNTPAFDVPTKFKGAAFKIWNTSLVSCFLAFLLQSKASRPWAGDSQTERENLSHDGKLRQVVGLQSTLPHIDENHRTVSLSA
jgi:hypothetical protein